MSFDPFADEQPVAARGLSDDDVKAIVGREITAAEDHAAVLSTARQDALEYYKGVDRWRSKPGQSSVVTREVLETVEWILPQLL
jgi:hypothetical protein